MADTDSIDVEEIISRVAKKHKKIIHDDDPIMMTVFLSEEIIGHHLEKSQESLKELRNSLESIYKAQETQAEKVVRIVMKECLDGAQEALGKSAHKASEDIKTALRTQQNMIEARIEKLHTETKRDRNISLIAAGVSLTAAMIMGIIVWF